MSVEEEIGRTVAKLMAGEGDPHEALRDLVSRVRPERVEKVTSCRGCGEEDALCFRCRAQEVLGDQVTMALPVLLPQLATLVRGWAAEGLAAARRRREATRGAQQQQQARRAPPPPEGRQSF